MSSVCAPRFPIRIRPPPSWFRRTHHTSALVTNMLHIQSDAIVAPAGGAWLQASSPPAQGCRAHGGPPPPHRQKYPNPTCPMGASFTFSRSDLRIRFYRKRGDGVGRKSHDRIDRAPNSRPRESGLSILNPSLGHSQTLKPRPIENTHTNGGRESKINEASSKRRTGGGGCLVLGAGPNTRRGSDRPRGDPFLWSSRRQNLGGGCVLSLK